MALAVRRMTELDLAGRRVMIREDLNAPIKDGKVVSDKRIRAALPTIQHALTAGARVIVLSHLGRPTEGSFDSAFSLVPVGERLSELLGAPVPVVKDWLDGVEVADGRAVLCENVRFELGETANDETLARRMAELCDVFVMDAFGTAHRAQASTCGVVRFAPIACAGPLLSRELEALTKALEHPSRPVVAIVGGAKVSSKLAVLRALTQRVDRLIVGGGIANTLLAACGVDVGRSLIEADQLDFAASLMAGEFGGISIPLPTDVVVAPNLEADARGTIVAIEAVPADQMILDIGPDTAARYAGYLKEAGTILWNGPVGVFEHPEFSRGTREIAAAVAASDAFSVAGGGDTVAAVEQFGVADSLSYISTGGGAFLEFLEGKKLPAVAALEARA